jgi:hypothetical protein
MTIPWTRLTHLLAGCTCIKPKCGLQQLLQLYHENGRDEFTSIRRTSLCCHENRIHLDRTLTLEPIPKGAIVLRPNSDRACKIQDKKSASASAMGSGSAHRHETQAKHRVGGAGQTSTRVFLHSKAAAKRPWCGLQKLPIRTEEDDRTDRRRIVSPPVTWHFRRARLQTCYQQRQKSEAKHHFTISQRLPPETHRGV